MEVRILVSPIIWNAVVNQFLNNFFFAKHSFVSNKLRRSTNLCFSKTRLWRVFALSRSLDEFIAGHPAKHFCCQCSFVINSLQAVFFGLLSKPKQSSLHFFRQIANFNFFAVNRNFLVRIKNRVFFQQRHILIHGLGKLSSFAPVFWHLLEHGFWFFDFFVVCHCLLDVQRD